MHDAAPEVLQAGHAGSRISLLCSQGWREFTVTHEVRAHLCTHVREGCGEEGVCRRPRRSEQSADLLADLHEPMMQSVLLGQKWTVREQGQPALVVRAIEQWLTGCVARCPRSPREQCREISALAP